MDFIHQIITNQVLWVPFCAWVLAQVLKLIIASITFRQAKWSYLTTMGGMPSSHSTLACALATTVGIVEGVGSVVFAISVFFAMIVMYDATGVRQTVSKQSVMLNRILDELLKGKPDFDHRLRELIGHSVIEVTAGALLGIIFSILVLVWI